MTPDANPNKPFDRRIELVAYDLAWPAAFSREQELIARALGSAAVELHHIGSTAIPGIAAKPLIDIMVAVAPLNPEESGYAQSLRPLGYHAEDVNDPGRWFFWKGRPRTHQIHIVEHDGWHYWRLLVFRDYLRTHPEAVREYEAVKRALAAKHGDRRKDYSNAKSSFVESLVRRAMGEKSEMYERWKKQLEG